ncbi:MAG: hypothetical protein H0U76_11630 [Ktedonobacteraceae bacterium]|nr:hypothetical protein [Ktedonobacteraceae bacterium]MBA3823754.1 hypothetical protein [Ktedonobacterales bacterium]
MANDTKEWLTQEEVANDMGVDVDKVRALVNALSRAGVVKTQRNPLDQRYVLIHKDSVSTIRNALGIAS